LGYFKKEIANAVEILKMTHKMTRTVF